ncbi:MAG: LSM domain-containing protein [Halobacteriota archaeon]|nr:LSM domain-containing protein [Halobacteriota archaeon]
MYPNKKVQSLIGSKVQVEMKGDKNTLEGILAGADDYLNLHLKEAMEVVDGERSRLLGSVILRGNNVVLINPIKS